MGKSPEETRPKLSRVLSHGCRGFHWGLLTQAPPAELLPKFQISSSVTLYTQFSHSEPPFYQSWETSQNLSPQTAAKGPPCKQDFLRKAVLGLI